MDKRQNKADDIGRGVARVQSQFDKTMAVVNSIPPAANFGPNDRGKLNTAIGLFEQVLLEPFGFGAPQKAELEWLKTVIKNPTGQGYNPPVDQQNSDQENNRIHLQGFKKFQVSQIMDRAGGAAGWTGDMGYFFENAFQDR